MGDIKGFMKYDRGLPDKRSVEDRKNDWKEIYDEDSAPST